MSAFPRHARAASTTQRARSAVVTPGTVIDLGDGNLLEVLSPERLTLEDHRETLEATAP
jgi:hypothetical protein